VPWVASCVAAATFDLLCLRCSISCLQTREYFIAAVVEAWDYVPFGGEMCGGSKVNFSDNAKTFVEPGPDRIGNKYLKAMYVEYTDATFKTRKVRELAGVNGDTIMVMKCWPN
jgi:hypothetical protein